MQKPNHSNPKIQQSKRTTINNIMKTQCSGNDIPNTTVQQNLCSLQSAFCVSVLLCFREIGGLPVGSKYSQLPRFGLENIFGLPWTLKMCACTCGESFCDYASQMEPMTSSKSRQCRVLIVPSRVFKNCVSNGGRRLHMYTHHTCITMYLYVYACIYIYVYTYHSNAYCLVGSMYTSCSCICKA